MVSKKQCDIKRKIDKQRVWHLVQSVQKGNKGDKCDLSAYTVPMQHWIKTPAEKVSR